MDTQGRRISMLSIVEILFYLLVGVYVCYTGREIWKSRRWYGRRGCECKDERNNEQ